VRPNISISRIYFKFWFVLSLYFQFNCICINCTLFFFGWDYPTKCSYTTWNL